MLSETQEIKIKYRRLNTLKVFLEDMTLSDEQITKILNEHGIETSSSTVGRDLTNKEIIPIILEIYPNKDPYIIFNSIKEARKANKKIGNRKGGITFAENNIAEKDDLGKFTGSKKK